MIDIKTAEKIQAIDQKSWGMIYKELVRYANYKLNKAGFEIRTEIDSVDAEHFATLAIEKLFKGERAWDFERYPDVTIHLIGIVKSLISSHFKESKRSVVSAGQRIRNFGNNYDEGVTQDELLDDDSLSTEGPEEIIIASEKWQELENAFGSAQKDEYAIFCEWLDNTKPRDIAQIFCR